MLTPSFSVWRILISLLILVFLTKIEGQIEVQLTGLENFDDNAFVVCSVDPLVHLGVFASADLFDDLVVILGP
jgi:hypothetical protein